MEPFPDIFFSKTLLSIARISSREKVFLLFSLALKKIDFRGFFLFFFTIFSYTSAIKKFQGFPVVSELKKKFFFDVKETNKKLFFILVKKLIIKKLIKTKIQETFKHLSLNLMKIG